MEINKTILFAIFCILFAGILFITDLLTPFIRPITYLFLMGSSKGKDILFFGLFGLFLILSQIINVKWNNNMFLKISIIIGSVLLVSGVFLEIIFRLQMGIELNTIFFAVGKSISSTSILHTHLLKSIFGDVITNLIGPIIQSDINTGVGLYDYVPSFGFFVILLIPLLFITIVLASQKRTWAVNLFLAFFSSCLIIGALDGGLFSTPAIVGIFGSYFIYRNSYYINYALGIVLKDNTLLEYNKSHPPIYKKHKSNNKRFIFNRISIYLLIILFIFLRFTIAFAGAETDYYTVEVGNISENVDFGDVEIVKINNSTYHVDSSYNEMDLINDLKVPLNNSCDYYTVSWNIYSYF